MTEKKAYIFDMDGTLVDNCHKHVEAWQEFSRGLGRELSEQEIIEWMGATGAYYIEKIVGRKLPEPEVARLCAEKERIYRAIYRPEMPAGLREWLDRAKRLGIHLAIATGGPRENVDYILDSLGLRRDFEVVIDASAYARSKPAPDCFLAAAAALGISPLECRVYEDAANGIRAAKAAGMECHAVTFTNPPAALAAAGADLVFDSYLELPARIENKA